MSTNTVFRPTAQLVDLSNVVDRALSDFIHARAGVLDRLGRYEAPIEACNLLNLAVRHLEAIDELVRRDLVLLPSAATIARAAMESGVRALWLLQPELAMDREARWLAHLLEEQRMHAKAAALLETIRGDSSSHHQQSATLREFADAVEAEFPAGMQVPSKVPDFRAMLRVLGEERKYLLYIELSQFTHSSHAAGALYRAHLGDKKQLGEYIRISQWAIPFAAAWPAFLAAARFLFLRVAPDRGQFLAASREEEIAALISEVSRVPDTAA